MIRGGRRLERLERLERLGRRRPARDFAHLSDDELVARIDAILLQLVAATDFDAVRAELVREPDSFVVERLDALKAAGRLARA